jgi:hypothetical protein
MDRQSLEWKLKRAKLVIGDVKDSCSTFFQKYNPPPIGCMFHDLDFYSSTADALILLDAGSAHFLPSVFMYFDDIIGNDLWLCNEFTGERLAIAEFNQRQSLQKICQMIYPRLSSYQIRIYHDFAQWLIPLTQGALDIVCRVI